MSTRLVSISPTVSTKANSGARQAQPRSGKFAMCAVAMPTRTIAQIAMAPMENSTLARPCVKAKARSRRSTTPVSSAISTSDRESRRNAGGSSNRHSIVCCGKKVAIELKVGESSHFGKTNEPGTWHGRCRPAPTDVHVTPAREPWLRRNSAQLVMAVILALGGAITYFTSRSTNPVTGEAQHVSLSPDQERMLGLQAMPAMAQQFGGEVNHPVLTPYVQSVGQRIVRQSDAARGPDAYTFHLL